ncbi:MAG: hypothetical protein ACP5HQ_02660 [Thermoprotei archaeon]
MTKRAVLLGVDGLSYSSFMKCSPRFIMALFNSTFRGVVKNDRLKDSTIYSWLEILTMENQEQRASLKEVPPLPLIQATGAEAVNIPITNPTYGVISLDFEKVDYFEEIQAVKDAVLKIITSGKPVIASITAIDRAVRDGRGDDVKCKVYAKADEAVKEIIKAADDFILFSPYGETKGNSREPYGVYIASVPRPHERETVSLVEIGRLFLDLIAH